MNAQPENKTAEGIAPQITYRKNSLEARLDELLPQGESYSVTFYELDRSEGYWSVNSGWTPVREVSRESAIESLRDRWEIFKLNYLPKARVQDIQDIGYDNECKLEVDCTAFADVTITNPIEDQPMNTNQNCADARNTTDKTPIGPNETGEDNRARIFVGHVRTDGKFPCRYVFPISDRKIDKILTVDQLAKESEKYLILPSRR